MEVVLKMLFLSLSNANVKFAKLEKLTWRIYITVEALSTTSWVKLIDKKKFAKAAPDKNSKTFVVHVAIPEVPTTIFIYPSRTSQIQRSDKPILAIL